MKKGVFWNFEKNHLIELQKIRKIRTKTAAEIYIFSSSFLVFCKMENNIEYRNFN